MDIETKNSIITKYLKNNEKLKTIGNMLGYLQWVINNENNVPKEWFNWFIDDIIRVLES